MEQFFTQQHHIPGYLCGQEGRLKLSGLLHYMEEASSGHLEAFGCPYEQLFLQGQVFVLTKMAVEIVRMPQNGETILVKTAPCPPKGALFPRLVLVEDQDGKQLVKAKTIWVLIDPQSRKVLRSTAFTCELPTIPGDVREWAGECKITPPSQLSFLAQRPVRYSDLDCNRHVNNAVYGDILCDYLPANILAEKELYRFLIHYENEACLGEEIRINGGQPDQNSYYIAGALDNKPCFQAEVRFR